MVVAIGCWGELNLKSIYCEDWRHPLYKRVSPVCNIDPSSEFADVGVQKQEQ